MKGAMHDTTDRSSPLDVFMDGACGLCQSSQRWCEAHDREGRVRFIDFRTSDDDDLPLRRSAHDTSMWVRDRDGSLLEGFAAWRRIMAELPGWRWLARLAWLPPFTLIGPPLYRLIAANRRRLPG